VTSALQVALGGEPFTLLAEHALIWPARRWLIVADVHFGKAATFRAHGVPVPHGTTRGTLTRLTALIERWQPQALVVLGDLFHAAEAHAPGTVATLLDWRARYGALDIVLVEGNHDRRAGAPPAALGVRVESEPWTVGAIALGHHPRFVPGAHALAGHLHPAVRISGRADDSLRLPCFWLRDGLTVLPAFGSFTGAARFAREPGDRVVAIGDGRLYEVPSLADAA
jgi:DNA ligase-associated metallophosphoesterase